MPRKIFRSEQEGKGYGEPCEQRGESECRKGLVCRDGKCDYTDN